MRGKELFRQAFDFVERHYDEDKKYSTASWTEFMGKAFDSAAKKLKMQPTRKRERTSKHTESGENLTIDVMLFDKRLYDKLWKRHSDPDMDAFILPEAVVELESSSDKTKIAYCLWKLLCIRSPLRMLLCYQRGKQKIVELRQYLQSVVKEGGLMKKDGGELIVIVCDESLKEDEPWEKYFNVYEWSRNRFERTDDYDGQ